MSVDQAPTRRAPDAKVVRYHDYIDEKIESTRRMVKVVDLMTSLVELAVAVLLFLLLAVVIEHWLVPGGFPVAVRMCLFAVLAGGGGYFVVRRLWPLCVRAINPVYAAQTIEHGSPGLKNGLINLLLFKQRRTEISDAVYRTLEEQAAHGLTRAPIDTAVDRSELIRLGYVLLAIVAVIGLYKVLSPKDPLIAAERVLMPWADIVPASRVTISDIKPGATTISRGELVEVSAEVHGLSEDETAVLRYSTEDGRVVGRAIPLKASSDGLRFNAQLADEGEGGPLAGVSSNLTYHLEAGDARSLDYAIKVVPAATILVESVDYHYPPYTGFVDKSVKGIGDIRAIEGTRITIHARANGKIQEAMVDFDADGRPDLQMLAADNQAKAAFDLGLREDRQTPLHASYVLRFKNDEGRENHGPVKHSINVDPDLKPEAEIRSPQEKVHDVRLNEGVPIEVEANDPDFALGAVRLHGEAAGQAVVDEKLFSGPQQKRFNGHYVFTPAAHGLKAGDVLEYWVEADDNRAPKPNTTTSEHRSLRIVSPNPAAQPPANQVAKNDRQPQQPQQPQQGDGAKGNDQQNGEQNQGNQSNNSGDPQSGGQNGQSQQGSGQSQKGKDGQGQQSKGDGQGQGDQSQGQGDKSQGKGDQSQSGNSGGDQQSGSGKEKNQSGDLKQNQTGSGQGDKSNQHDGKGDSGGQSSPGGSAPNKSDSQNQNEQSGASSPGSEQSKDGAQPNGAQSGNSQPNNAQPNGKKDGQSQGSSSQNSQQQTGEQQKGQSPKNDQQSGAQQEQSPVSSEGDNDAEAFSRIQKHMEQKGDLKPEENSANGEQQADDKNQSSQKQNSGQQKKQGDKAGSQEQQGNDESSKDKGKTGDRKSPDGSNSAQSPGEKKQDGKKGQGAETSGDDSHQKGEQKGDSQSQQHSPGGEQSASKGTSGGGNEEKSQGAPNSKPEMKPSDRPEQSSSSGNKTEEQKPPANGNGKRESDSHGEQGADKPVGSKEGGGKKSPHDGTGSTGQNQSADNGGGESGEKGKGDNSPNAGHDAKSDNPTGASDGKTPGKGSQQKDGAGDKPGGKPGADKTGDKSAAKDDGKNANGDGSAKSDQSNNGDQGNKSEKSDKSDQSSDRGPKSSDGGKDLNQKPGTQQGDKPPTEPNGKNGDRDGTAGDGQNGKANQEQSNANQDGKNAGEAFGANGPASGAFNPQPSSTGEAPEGDAANLEYTRKQTDLVVDKLANQLNRKDVDKGMLKELGWSEAELKRFVERWQQRKAAAEKNDETGEAAKKELDDALRSLGLRRGALQQNAAQKDTMRDLHEGYHGPVPAEYKDRLRAYNQGVSRVHPDGE